MNWCDCFVLAWILLRIVRYKMLFLFCFDWCFVYYVFWSTSAVHNRAVDLLCCFVFSAVAWFVSIITIPDQASGWFTHSRYPRGTWMHVNNHHLVVYFKHSVSCMLVMLILLCFASMWPWQSSFKISNLVWSWRPMMSLLSVSWIVEWGVVR